MRIELEDQGIKIKGHVLGSFSGWAEIDEDTGKIEKLVIYEDVGFGLGVMRTEVDLTSARGVDASFLRSLLETSIYLSDRVRNIVHERQQSLVRDRIAARAGDRTHNAEL